MSPVASVGHVPIAVGRSGGTLPLPPGFVPPLELEPLPELLPDAPPEPEDPELTPDDPDDVPDPLDPEVPELLAPLDPEPLPDPDPPPDPELVVLPPEPPPDPEPGPPSSPPKTLPEPFEPPHEEMQPTAASTAKAERTWTERDEAFKAVSPGECGWRMWTGRTGTQSVRRLSMCAPAPWFARRILGPQRENARALRRARSFSTCLHFPAAHEG